ncbi:DNA/RNA helicase [Nitratireductor sp.]|uniref:DNA/RNA helicase n=1 Tax=Nitratireductor sp. TaxID=1872084 RepID=UPI0026276F06|nr:DNA/RNA helicase [Nitratireductor sp.]MCV0381740.1 DNA/RNA helicase [Nitratireductor sp.]
MIEILGIEGTAEFEAALSVKDALCRTWPGIDTTPIDDDHVKIVSGLKLSGHKVSDIDVVVVGRFRTPRYIVPATTVHDTDGNRIVGAKIRVRSFIVAIEVKDHPATGMKIEAGGVSVRYGKDWKSATDQNEAQRYALLEYLREVTTLNPWIFRCLMLRGIDQLPKARGRVQPASGAIAAGFDATSLIVAMATVNGIPKLGKEHTIKSADDGVMDLVLDDGLFRPLVPSDLDRKRMDRIAARPAEARELAKLLGEHRVHLRGHGGTGKTVLLLQSAYEAFLTEGKRSLVLTYNTALAADIQRTLALMNIPGEGEGGGIRIRTVMSFMYAWLHRLGVVEDGNIELDDYQDDCRQALNFLDEGVVTPADIEAAKASDFLQFDYDAILVDEAQDWPQPEADLLCRLYGGNAVSLADGMEQLVRGSPTNWKSSVADQPKVGFRHLEAGLRMKSNLCHFANALAAEAGLPWKVSANPEAAGGRVLVIEGFYESRTNLQRSVLSSAIRAGNMPIDLLHCVPPSGVGHKEGRKYSKLGQAFQSNDWEVWDGVDDVARRHFPRSAEMLRIVQFESCRGLEGWTTVLDGLDEFWQLKRNAASSGARGTGIVDVEQHAEAAAWRWCMIPITRPIDTLVIALRDPESRVARALREVARKMPDTVEFQ